MPVDPRSQSVAPFVAYEVRRLLEDAREIDRVKKAFRRERTARLREELNRAVESFLLHARNVYDLFFIEPRKEKPDLFYTHFLDNGHGWVPDGKTLCPYLTDERERLNRALQHLSYDRIKHLADGNRNWEAGTILRELGSLCRRLLALMPDERRRWFVPNGGDPEYFPLEELSKVSEK